MSRWTKDQELTLLDHVGVSGQAKLKRVLVGKSLGAIQAKAHRDFGSSSLTRGTHSLRDICRLTGYSRTQFLRAQRALRQRWHRTRVGGQYMITVAQIDEMTEWLKTDYWSAGLALYGCIWCTTESRPMRSLGLCSRCYYRYRRLVVSLGLPVTHHGMLRYVRRKSDRDMVYLPLVKKVEKGLALTQVQLEFLVGK
jgi:hypothetical protein